MQTCPHTKRSNKNNPFDKILIFILVNVFFTHDPNFGLQADPQQCEEVKD